MNINLMLTNLISFANFKSFQIFTLESDEFRNDVKKPPRMIEGWYSMRNSVLLTENLKFYLFKIAL